MGGRSALTNPNSIQGELCEIDNAHCVANGMTMPSGLTKTASLVLL